MKRITSTSILLLISVLIINFVSGKKCLVDVSKSEKDRYYLVYVQNNYGEFKVFDKIGKRKRQESKSDEFVFSLVDDIHSLIMDNKDTYKNQEKFEELVNSTNLRKRSYDNDEGYYNGESSFVFPISAIGNTVVFNAYLSKPVMNKLKNYHLIKAIEPDLPTGKYQGYYNTTEILEETQWQDLSVRENADFHLSLLSQGKYDKNIAKYYDNNYYYPSSAGKDVDIYILDSGFHFDYDEFSNTDERIVECIGDVVHGNFTDNNTCDCTFSRHGDVVADMAGGLVYGAANKANIYAIAHATKYIDIQDSDALTALQRVYEEMRDYRTVVSISYALVHQTNSTFYGQYTKIIKGITDKGGIIVGSALSSHSHMHSKDTGNYFLPCSDDNVICVGGVENKSKYRMDTVLTRSKKSAYGDDIDINGPFYVTSKIRDKDGEVKVVEQRGCSFATPLVSGVIATIISDHPDVSFTKSTMLDYLLKNALPFDENGKTSYFINNGKHLLYSGDEVSFEVYYECDEDAEDEEDCEEIIITKTPTTTTTKTTTTKKSTPKAQKTTSIVTKKTTVKTTTKKTTTKTKTKTTTKKTTVKTTVKKTTVKTTTKKTTVKTTAKKTNVKTTAKKTTAKKTTTKKPTTNKKTTNKKTTNKKTTNKKTTNKKTTKKNSKNTKKGSK